MLIEDLIRLGRPLLDGDMKPAELLSLITDAADVRVKNFYRNVFVVVLESNAEPHMLARQVLGNPTDDGDFEVNVTKALGIPITLPSGGNPLNPQGRYGVPAYPLYDPHIKSFTESSEQVKSFLDSRIERTPELVLNEEQRQSIALAIHEQVKTTALDPKKNLGVLVLAQCSDSSFFTCAKGKRADSLGQLPDGRVIVPDHKKILAAILDAKVEEGREAGVRTGACSITGEGEEAVSAYCKAWPWAFPTWTCPLPDGGDEAKIVEGIGVSPTSYRALTVGASVFNRLTKRVDHVVIPEIFSPANSRPGKEQAQRRSLNDLPSIYGSAFLLPLLDRSLDDPDQRFEFVRGLRQMLAADPHDTKQAERYLTGVFGFEAFLPTEFEKENQDEYRLTLVYFSGEYTRGDVKLRAFIQDVVPSMLGRLRTIGKSEAVASLTLLTQLLQGMSVNQRSWYAQRYSSAPWLLTRAYGGAYLWSQLETLLQGRKLDSGRVQSSLARRLESLVPTWPKSRLAIVDEIGFYLNFLRFLGRVNREVAGVSEDESMAIQHWKELLQEVEHGPLDGLLAGERAAAELGFACGALIRRFSNKYYVKMRGDYLRDRVLTFGSDLRPAAVLDRGLKLILELPGRLKELKRNPKFEERVGAVINACQRRRDVIDTNKDEFMTAFWSGYAVQGFDRQPKPKSPAKFATANLQE
jgi:hypothetical protein